MPFEKIKQEIQNYVEEILKNDEAEDLINGEDHSGLEMPE